jgi:hypothetical protein
MNWADILIIKHGIYTSHLTTSQKEKIKVLSLNQREFYALFVLK